MTFMSSSCSYFSALLVNVKSVLDHLSPKMNLLFICGVTFISSTLSTSITQAEPKVKRSEEMEFDARVIQGQRAEGAVYLFQRGVRSLPPLLNYKRDYLRAIVSPVFGQDTKLGQSAQAQLKQTTISSSSGEVSKKSSDQKDVKTTSKAQNDRLKKQSKKGKWKGKKSKWKSKRKSKWKSKWKKKKKR